MLGPTAIPTFMVAEEDQEGELAAGPGQNSGRVDLVDGRLGCFDVVRGEVRFRR